MVATRRRASCLDEVEIVSAVIAVAVLTWFAAVPLLVLVVDFVLALALVLAAVVARTLLGRPWLIDAEEGDGAHVTRAAVGWRGSAQAIQGLRAEIALGAVEPRGPG
jgi:hypothetical protein